MPLPTAPEKTSWPHAPAMESLARIVAPVDFSERSAGAVRCATVLARHFRSELSLLHVFLAPPLEFGSTAGPRSVLEEVYRSREAEVTRELDGFLAGELGGLAVRRVAREGDTARRIVEFAHEQRAGLIVMATHGHGPLRGFLLGSNTARVLHDAECPVWTGVHLEGAPVAPFAPFRSLVCAVDLGPQSRALIEWAATFQKEFGARLTLAHAITPPSTDIDSAPAWLRRAQQSAEEELSRLAEEAGAFAELAVAPGEPEQVINSVVLRAGGELLIIGRGSAAGSFGRLRKHAYTLIRQSACPVVSV